MRRMLTFLLLATSLFAASDVKRAQELYQRTQYRASLAILQAESAPDASAYALMGKNWYMLSEYKKAAEVLQQAVSLDAANSGYIHWLGRVYGRRAETASPLLAPGYASKTRQCFEKAVELDPKNEEALSDLFDYYLQAPGFLGGGLDKASALAKRIGELNPAEYHFAQARLAEHKKQYDTAEEQLRRAAALAPPRKVGRIIDLAEYLAKQGRYQESDETFRQAQQIAPDSPKVMYARATALIEHKRNLAEAKVLLEKYLQSNLTPEDPPREEAYKLLKRASTGA